MSLLRKNPQCPYCGGKLDKRPTRKKKCPLCGEFIYVRRGELLTEHQATERDLLSRWLSFLEQYGVDEKQFMREREQLSKEFGFKASVRDTLWRVMNNALVSRQQDLFDLERLYLVMARFVEEEGKSPKPFVRQAMEVKEISLRAEILDVDRNLGKVGIRINTANDNHVCEACKQASKKVYTIEEFLRDMPIPRKCVNQDGCRCWVTEQID